MAAAFLTPLSWRVRLSSPRQTRHADSLPRRRSVCRARRAWTMCAPPEDERSGERGHGNKLSERERIDVATTEALNELDELAEEWIGSDLGRWEWYERMKARRARMVRIVEESEEKLDREMGELKRAFVEFDAVFGTRTIDEKSEIQVSGWAIVAFVMMLYVVVGYAVCEGVVRVCTTLDGGAFPF